MSKFGLSQPVRRVEDARFVTGAGRYTDDLNLPGQARSYVLRSPLAHARVKSVDTEAARATPGVVAVITGADLEADGVGHIPTVVPLENRDGTPSANPKRPALCTDTVRHVGDNVAFVVAETLEQAKDAAELVQVDYEPLPVVADASTAMDAGQPALHAEAPDNLAFDWEFGDRAAVDAAFAEAAHVTTLDLVNNRVVVNSIEPRNIIADWDSNAGKLTIHGGTQGGWLWRDQLAADIFGMAPDRIRVVTPDTGGSFGMKQFVYPELVMTAWAARKLRRPVKWIGERSDAFVSDTMGRGNLTRASMAFDAHHRIVAVEVATVADMGAYLSTFAPFIPTLANIKVLAGVYDFKHLFSRVKGVMTNTVPVDAYRGAGRPEAIYTIERLMDRAARELGEDPTELRRKNFIKPESMPYATAAGETYDTGEFAQVMDAAMANADWAGFPARQAAARAAGKRRGIGLCYYIESTMGDGNENAAVRFDDDGMVSILVGTQSTGQGHETAYAQILNDKLGVPLDRIRVIQGDTDLIPTGGGTGGSRSVTAEGWAIQDASDKVIERGKAFASQVLEAAVADIEFGDGAFRIAGTDRAVAILDLADQAKAMESPPDGLEGGLDADAHIEVQQWTFPNGCHMAEVEIDPETGVTRVLRYTVVDDFGTTVNPMLIEGQVDGGVVQGLGQALMEHTVHDRDGQLLSGSFMDYAMPRADDVPPIDFANIVVPCKNNPMGMKGCGEAGSVGSLAAAMNAILDALALDGVTHIDMPATPEIVWRALHRN